MIKSEWKPLGESTLGMAGPSGLYYLSDKGYAVVPSLYAELIGQPAVVPPLPPLPPDPLPLGRGLDRSWWVAKPRSGCCCL